jgi:hypothetical protein
METITLNPLCLQNTLEGNIHEVVLLKASRDTIDLWIAAMELIQNQRSAEIERFLIDLRAEAQPAAYMIRRLEELLDRYPLLLSDRIAFLHGQDFPMALVQAQLKTLGWLPRKNTHFFAAKDRNPAIEWLLKK